MERIKGEKRSVEFALAEAIEELEINASAASRKMELALAEAIQEHEIHANASRMKMRKIKRYALDKEMHLHYAFAAIVILVAVIIALLGLLRCKR